MVDYVVHFEIPANNTTRAKRFYEKMFGWNISFMKGFDYFSIKAKGEYQGKPAGIDGGMMKRTAKGQPLTFYVMVGSVDAALKKAVANGGKVCMPKTSIGDMGFIGAFSDPEGNLVGLTEMSAKMKKPVKKKR